MKTLVVPPRIFLIGNDAVGDLVRTALAEPYCGSFGVEKPFLDSPTAWSI